MGLFDVFKKKEQANPAPENNILLSMPLFNNGDRYNLDAVVANLQNDWELSVTNIEGDSTTAVLTINDTMVAISFLDVPVPAGDISETAIYAYNWEEVLEDLKDNSGHAIVAIMKGPGSVADRYRLLTKVLAAILQTSDAVGIYQGNQSLLIPKDQYLARAAEIKDDTIPLNLWVYIGLRQSNKGNSLYTYGLTAFGKQEIEVINSAISLEDLYEFVANIAAYVIKSDITFNHGETLGYTAEQKVNISSSKGIFVEGKSLKLEM